MIFVLFTLGMGFMISKMERYQPVVLWALVSLFLLGSLAIAQAKGKAPDPSPSEASPNDTGMEIQVPDYSWHTSAELDREYETITERLKNLNIMLAEDKRMAKREDMQYEQQRLTQLVDALKLEISRFPRKGDLFRWEGYTSNPKQMAVAVVSCIVLFILALWGIAKLEQDRLARKRKIPTVDAEMMQNPNFVEMEDGRMGVELVDHNPVPQPAPLDETERRSPDTFAADTFTTGAIGVEEPSTSDDDSEDGFVLESTSFSDNLPARRTDELAVVDDKRISLRDMQLNLDSLLAKNDQDLNPILDFVLQQATSYGASDIHCEHRQDRHVVRFRVDGELQEILSLPEKYEKNWINVIKVRSQLKIFERAKVQEGRLPFSYEGKTLYCRVSIMPNIGYEKVVLRVFGEDSLHYELGLLGLSDITEQSLKLSLQRRSGLVFLVGPTGSGKTTTIYSALRYVLQHHRGANVVTIEDPVERRLDGITQIEINPTKNMTFENTLASVLRQDPEVIMVGEIRDKATADLAIQAGLTGHLALTTLHTSSTSGVVDRLLGLGVDAVTLYEALSCIVSQRLIRKNCLHCAEPYQPEAYAIEAIEPIMHTILEPNWLRGQGCDRCLERGFWGRTPIDETLIMTAAGRDELLSARDVRERKQALQALVASPIFNHGVIKASEGVTPLEEILQVLA